MDLKTFLKRESNYIELTVSTTSFISSKEWPNSPKPLLADNESSEVFFVKISSSSSPTTNLCICLLAMKPSDFGLLESNSLIKRNNIFDEIKFPWNSPSISILSIIYLDCDTVGLNIRIAAHACQLELFVVDENRFLVLIEVRDSVGQALDECLIGLNILNT